MSMNREPGPANRLQGGESKATGRYEHSIARCYRMICAPAHIIKTFRTCTPGQATGPGKNALMRASERKHTRMARSLVLQLRLAANLSR
jgi:hypothetical protein